MEAVRAAMPSRPAPARTTGPRQGTKQEAVLALLRRPEGATVAQVAGATGWAYHTVRGFLAGLKKRGIAVEVLERVRQVGPNRQGARGSYSIYRIAEAG
jgi:predicted ArsR family transcriptional regulator